MKRRLIALSAFFDFLFFFLSALFFYREYVGWERPYLAVALSVLCAFLFAAAFPLCLISRKKNGEKNGRAGILTLLLPAAFYLAVTYGAVAVVNQSGTRASEAVMASYWILFPIFALVSVLAQFHRRPMRKRRLPKLLGALEILLFVLFFSFGVVLHENGYAQDLLAGNFKRYLENDVLYDVKYGKDKRQTLNLYIPKEADETCGLILYIHGGAWVAGDKSAYNDSLEQAAERGYVAAAVNYHYADEDHSVVDMMNDITLALEKVKEICTLHGIRLSKVLLTGRSAGGHLSLQYGYQMADVSPVPIGCIVSLCGPTDLTDERFYRDNPLGSSAKVCKLLSNLSGVPFDETDVGEHTNDLRAASPITYVTESSVPTVICHGQKDTLVPYQNALALDAKLTECGVEHVLIPFPHSGHGLSDDPKSTAYATCAFWIYAERYLR